MKQDENNLNNVKNKTYDARIDNLKSDTNSNKSSVKGRKPDEVTTPETAEDKMNLGDLKDSKLSYFENQIKLNLNESFFKNDKSKADLDSLDDAEDHSGWKSSPLYIISHGWDTSKDVINILLDIKGIDHKMAGIEEFKDLDIIEFEGEVNIILQALKNKAKAETFIIWSSVEDSKDSKGNDFIPKVDENNNLHTFIHTSRYIRTLENTIRYLLHCVGLSKYLTGKRISDQTDTDKIDFLDNEIKMCLIIQRLFKFIKQWYWVFETYHYRETKITEIREGLKNLRQLYLQFSSKGKNNEQYVKTIEENEQIEMWKNRIIGQLYKLTTLNSEMYQEIKAWVKENNKLLNYTLKYLNNPEYYLKSNRHGSISPTGKEDDDRASEVKTDVNVVHTLSTKSGKIDRHQMLQSRTGYRNVELFRWVFPNKELLNNDIRKIRQDYQELQNIN